jgi:threonine synthase
MWQGIIHRYRDYLPITDLTPIITLNEGNTPLIEAKNLSQFLGGNFRIFLKYEGVNPTGSFKDRGMTVAISKAVEEGAKVVICASTGNTSASAAAYAAKAKINCAVLIPSAKIAMGKLAQAMMHGAMVIAVEGGFDAALDLVKSISSNYPVKVVNSINPHRIEGQKTAAFEICDQLGQAPDYQAMPVGNAGNITAYWQGYKEYKAAKQVDSTPKMLGFQAAGAAPIVEGRVIKNPKSIASAIEIGNPASWKRAEAARDESGGLIDKVTDEEIVDAYKLLPAMEGVFVEAASAASVAGVIKLSKKDYFPKGSTVVCILTGHGLKDPDRAIISAPRPHVVPASEAAIVELLRLE